MHVLLPRGKECIVHTFIHIHVHAFTSLQQHMKFFICVFQRWISRPQIHKFLVSFRNSKCATFLGVPIRQSQIRTFPQNTCTTLSQNSLKGVLINKAQICKFLWLIRKSANVYKTLHIASRNSPKSRFIWIRALYAVFKVELVYICGLAEVSGPQIISLGSQIGKMAHLRKGWQFQQIFQFRKVADLQFAELICGPPTFCLSFL